MGEALAKLLAGQERERSRAHLVEHRRWRPSKEELGALHKLQAEAELAGATLVEQGRGIVAPSLALHVLRSFDFRCAKCRRRDSALEVMRVVGDVDEPANMTARCRGCDAA